MEKTALLIIDVQNEMVLSQRPVLFEREQVLENLRTLIARAREEGVPVVFVQHEEENGSLRRGSKAWEIYEGVAPLSGEPVVSKTVRDAFSNPELKRILDGAGIKRLVIAGLQTDFCVNATLRRAAALGYECVAAGDAHSTFGRFPYPGGVIVRRHNRAWNRIAAVEKTSGIRF